MATAVKSAVSLGAIFGVALLLDGKGIHIGTQPDRLLGRSSLQNSNNAALPYPVVDLIDTKGFQQFDRGSGGPVQVKGNLGFAMKAVPPISHLICKTLSSLLHLTLLPFRPKSCIACALGRIRTCDTRFRKPVLYPLSYEGGNRNVRSNVNWYLTISPDPREVEEGL